MPESDLSDKTLAVSVTTESIVALSFDLPEAIPYIASLRKTARCMIEGLGVSERDVDDLETVIGELATNAARHAKGGQYHVRIEMFENKVTITVKDYGVGFRPERVSPPGSLRVDDLADLGDFTEDLPVRFGGFGLPLVYSLADLVEISPNEPRGTIVRAQKTVQCAL